MLATLLNVDDTDLHAFNNDKESTQDVVQKTQTLFDAWHASLKFTGDCLKLNK